MFPARGRLQPLCLYFLHMAMLAEVIRGTGRFQTWFWFGEISFLSLLSLFLLFLVWVGVGVGGWIR